MSPEESLNGIIDSFFGLVKIMKKVCYRSITNFDKKHDYC